MRHGLTWGPSYIACAASPHMLCIASQHPATDASFSVCFSGTSVNIIFASPLGSMAAMSALVIFLACSSWHVAGGPARSKIILHCRMSTCHVRLFSQFVCPRPQTMDPADEDKFDFDPLDVTKTWPEDIFPLQPVGRLVLNKNVDNFFAENEQLAFAPGLVVPGTSFCSFYHAYSPHLLPCGHSRMSVFVICPSPDVQATFSKYAVELLSTVGTPLVCLIFGLKLAWACTVVRPLTRASAVQASTTRTTSCCRRASSRTRTRSATGWAPTTCCCPPTRRSAHITTTTTRAS